MRLLEDEIAHSVETMCLLEDKMTHRYCSLCSDVRATQPWAHSAAATWPA
jgi:hypothetical protein